MKQSLGSWLKPNYEHVISISLTRKTNSGLPLDATAHLQRIGEELDDTVRLHRHGSFVDQVHALAQLALTRDVVVGFKHLKDQHLQEFIQEDGVHVLEHGHIGLQSNAVVMYHLLVR